MHDVKSISFAAIETVFLDAGNTLIAMDYDWVARELAAAGHPVEPSELSRAEAAARPATSAHTARAGAQSGRDAFEFYFARILERIPAVQALGPEGRAGLIRTVAPALKQPGADHRLWSRVLPGVPEALAAMRCLGLDLVVVSNSDGSVRQALDALGLAAHLSWILDSAVVGYEKPDRRFFEHALAVSGARRETTLHVGDMYHQDVRGARSAGIEAVLLDPFGDWDVDDCFRCTDLADLTARIRAAAD